MAAQPQHVPGAPPAFAHRRNGSSGSFNAHVQQVRKSITKTPPPFGRALSGDWSQQIQSQQARKSTKTPPPFGRTPSGDWTQQIQGQRTPPSRPNSRGAGMYLNQPSGLVPQQGQRTPPSRPHSRGAGMYLNPPSGRLQSSQPANLSAREQMHVARATGTPLLDTSANARKKTQDVSGGLVGAVGAREREKAAMKASHRSSMAVENAIRARQDQQAEAQMLAYQQQMQQAQQQQNAYYAQQQQQAAYGFAGPETVTPGAQYGFAGPGTVGPGTVTPGAQFGQAGGYMTPQQQQQIWQQQQQQQMQSQGAQTPGNRQSWFGGSYFGGQQPQQ